MSKETNPALALAKLGTASALGAYGIFLEAAQRAHQLQARRDSELLKTQAEASQSFDDARDFNALLTAQLQLLNGQLAQHNEFWREWFAACADNQLQWAEHCRKMGEDVQHGMASAMTLPDLLGAGTSAGEAARAVEAPLQKWFQAFNDATQSTMDVWRRMSAEAAQATQAAASPQSPLNGRVPPRRGGAQAQRSSA
ncbi:hypothetical protein HUS70_04810 [Pandoraea nosoerga]|uniref:Phasin domain-containing protein n=1 Tax=Pandoraea nosoerga TaxID=2508296 RepID=A0A5E4SM98_9BURK|nr:MULTISPECIES: hypothetical protein [Pandoraea]MBN4665302.1 hypothetical protein [Pandoraea nosoerga]MBN4674702.1 hypothetical protein [Pandoraea nosoerga]MBN4680591.1 hypothetical protein [Pandoraea nosoerga]MBN4743996.1 hypothetical protein [Pandoraea nosoerga]VVD75009.1 hypothetical protein PNO31109_00784 [Pandoraea nosoerga]